MVQVVFINNKPSSAYLQGWDGHKDIKLDAVRFMKVINKQKVEEFNVEQDDEDIKVVNYQVDKHWVWEFYGNF